MAEPEDSIAVERVKNLISGFGWSVDAQQMQTDRIVLTISKSRTPAEETESASPG